MFPASHRDPEHPGGRGRRAARARRAAVHGAAAAVRVPHHHHRQLQDRYGPATTLRTGRGVSLGRD